MSHLTKYHIVISDLEELRSTLDELQNEQKLNYEWLGEGRQKTYSATTKGTHFQLNNWKYPICVTKEGELEFDNYGGNWGSAEDLDNIVQRYTKRVITRNARRQGYQVTAKTDSKGNVQLKLYQ